MTYFEKQQKLTVDKFIENARKLINDKLESLDIYHLIQVSGNVKYDAGTRSFKIKSGLENISNGFANINQKIVIDVNKISIRISVAVETKHETGSQSKYNVMYFIDSACEWQSKEWFKNYDSHGGKVEN